MTFSTWWNSTNYFSHDRSAMHTGWCARQPEIDALTAERDTALARAEKAERMWSDAIQGGDIVPALTADEQEHAAEYVTEQRFNGTGNAVALSDAQEQQLQKIIQDARALPKLLVRYAELQAACQEAMYFFEAEVNSWGERKDQHTELWLLQMLQAALAAQSK